MVLSPTPRRPRSAAAVRKAVERRIAEAVFNIVRADRSVSATLQFFLGITKTGRHVSIGVPHFWARWYHDGRGEIRAAPGRFLAFWVRSALSKDPRLAGQGYPIFKNQRRRLDREQFMQAMSDPDFVFTKRVGPFAGNPFFTRAFRAVATDKFWTDHVDDEAERQLTGLLDVKLRLKPGQFVRKERPAVVRLEAPA